MIQRISHKKIKVLFCVNTMEIGGTERNVLNIARTLNKDIFEPYVWCATGKGPLYEELSRYASVFCLLAELPSILAWIIRKSVFLMIFRPAYFYRLNRRYKFDIVFSLGESIGFWVMPFALLLRIPVRIFSVQDWEIE